jgi:hypothetical protein
MWTPEERALVGDLGCGQALSGEQYDLVEPLIPPPKPGGRPRTPDMRRVLDGRPGLPRPHRLPLAASAAAPGVPAVADRLRVLS